jgi:hypothetical protein
MEIVFNEFVEFAVCSGVFDGTSPSFLYLFRCELRESKYKASSYLNESVTVPDGQRQLLCKILLFSWRLEALLCLFAVETE